MKKFIIALSVIASTATMAQIRINSYNTSTDETFTSSLDTNGSNPIVTDKDGKIALRCASLWSHHVDGIEYLTGIKHINPQWKKEFNSAYMLMIDRASRVDFEFRGPGYYSGYLVARNMTLSRANNLPFDMYTNMIVKNIKTTQKVSGTPDSIWNKDTTYCGMYLAQVRKTGKYNDEYVPHKND